MLPGLLGKNPAIATKNFTLTEHMKIGSRKYFDCKN